MAGLAFGATPRIPPQPLDPGAINNPGTTDIIGPGSQGQAVVRAQVLLQRARFSCGEIDGVYGRNLQVTVSAYQAAHGLPGGGIVEQETWKALNADTAPALLTYTISPDDVKGPFVKIPAGMMAKARLPQLGYESPLEELGEKFHASPKLLRQLNPGKAFDQAGEQVIVPNVVTMPPVGAATVVVSKSQSSVSVYDAQGKPLAFYCATIGSRHDPLPIGNWTILGVQRNPVFHYNPKLFWNADPNDSTATIQAGPNNPVGVVWIALSKQHYGIHGTPEPAKIGHTESHGCIRLTNWDASELATMVRPAMPAILKE